MTWSSSSSSLPSCSMLHCSSSPIGETEDNLGPFGGFLLDGRWVSGYSSHYHASTLGPMAQIGVAMSNLNNLDEAILAAGLTEAAKDYEASEAIETILIEAMNASVEIDVKYVEEKMLEVFGIACDPDYIGGHIATFVGHYCG